MPFRTTATKSSAERRENKMSNQWSPIRYREFWDFPRAFVVEHSGELFLLDCLFDDVRDDYDENFTVFKIRDEYREKVDQPSWENLSHYADRMGSVAARVVKFDETKRQAVDVEVFSLIVKNP